MEKPVGLGFIGCGGHSARHADVALKMPHAFRIVGAMDSDATVARIFAQKYGDGEVLATTDISRFLAIGGLEAVVIGTPHRYHLELCDAALTADKHILCEKPLWEGAHAMEASNLLSRAEQKGLTFSSCHLRRFEKEYVYIKEHLAEYQEKFGTAVEVRFQFFYHEPSTGWKLADSLLLDHMNHEIDLVHFLFGESPATFWRLSHGFDEYRVAGKTDTGLAIWFSGYRRLKSRTFRNELEIVFERGRVRTEVVLDSATGMVSSAVKVLSFEDNSEATTMFKSHSYDDALVGVMSNFAATIRGEETCYLTAKDLLDNTSICNALIRQEHGKIY